MSRVEVRESQERLHVLDGMRGVAAMVVAFGHFGLRTHLLIQEGYLAVDFFFLLSGLVIALNYSKKLTNGMSVFMFFEKRLIRLYPLYIAGLFLGAAKYIVENILHSLQSDAVLHEKFSFLFNALMLPSPTTWYDGSGVLFPFNPPAWSLFYEMIISVVFAVILYRLSTRSLMCVSVVSAIVLLLTIGSPLFFNVGWGWANAFSGGARVFFAFPLGVVLFRAFGVSAPTKTNSSFLLMFVLVLLLIFPVTHREIYEFFVVFLIFPLLIVAGMRLQPVGLGQSVCAFLGDISYPVYALHFPLLAVFTPGVIARLTPVGSYLALLVLLPLCGWASYRFYDGPIRRLLSSMMASVRLTASRSAT